MSKYLETLPQYHFDRDDFCKVFGEVFTNDEIIDIDVMWVIHRTPRTSFSIAGKTSFYIIHRDSGTIINWYKHLGRTNTCNKEGFTLADLKELLLLLKERRRRSRYETMGEYEALQAALTKKSENNPYGRTGNFKREDGYKEGILAAKSILHSFYQRQSQGKEESQCS